jgi:hypothetical protein
MTSRACLLFQARFDVENARNYKNGTYLSNQLPHPCKGCEFYLAHQDRPKLPDRRKPPKKNLPETPVTAKKRGPKPQPKLRAEPKLRCIRCGTEAPEMFTEKARAYLCALKTSVVRSIYCIECKKERRRELTSTRVDVVCPVCGIKRNLSRRSTKTKGFTGICNACASKNRKKPRPMANNPFKRKFERIPEMMDREMNAKEISRELGIGLSTAYYQMNKVKCERLLQKYKGKSN